MVRYTEVFMMLNTRASAVTASQSARFSARKFGRPTGISTAAATS